MSVRRPVVPIVETLVVYCKSTAVDAKELSPARLCLWQTPTGIARACILMRFGCRWSGEHLKRSR